MKDYYTNQIVISVHLRTYKLKTPYIELYFYINISFDQDICVIDILCNDVKCVEWSSFTQTTRMQTTYGILH